MRLFALLLLAGCELTNPVPVQPDYPPMPPFGVDAGASCEKACAKLRSLGCPEATPDCTKGCVAGSEVRAFPLDCWADAGDQLAARACGGLRCKEMRP